MKHLGIFLGVPPHAGGMFQYAQAMLDALVSLPSADYTLHAVYCDEHWAPILREYPRFSAMRLKLAGIGQKMATAMMVLRLPVHLTRLISAVFNPIAWQLKKQKCDYWIFPAQDAIGYQIRVRSVVSIHDLMHRYEARFPEVLGHGRYKIREHRFGSLALTAEKILVDSVVGKEHVCLAYGTDAGKVYPLPYIPPRYIYDATEPEDFSSRYLLPEKYIFYPAQFWPHKNHIRLLEAVAAARAKKLPLKMVFSGGKLNEYENVRLRVEQLGLTDSVTFLGYVPDQYLRGIYERARAMIMPTAFGPTNIPPLEAFACGCPTAVSDIYGMPEQTAGAALLFDPESAEAMTTVLTELWQDDELCNRLSQAGLEHAKSWGRPQFAARLKDILASSSS